MIDLICNLLHWAEELLLTTVNPTAWVISNALVAYVGFVLLFFIVAYPILFDPRATTGGRIILQFAASLVGVIGLIFISVFVDPRQPWFEYPGDILWWRPVTRLIFYGLVAYSSTNLAIFLIVRKWWPHKVKTAPDRDLVKPRKEDRR